MPALTRLRTGDQTLIREINLSVIMNRLHRDAPISRAALAEMTGLNKSTVSSLVNELIERRFVQETGIVSSGVGRPSVQLALNSQAGYIVSIELHVGVIVSLCTDFTANVLWTDRTTIAPDAEQKVVMQRVLALIREAMRFGEQAIPGQNLLGIAIGVPGLVEQDSGTLLFAPNLGWHNVPIRAIVQQEFPNTPIFVDNEANMAALGEYFFGAGQDYNDILYVSIGVGLGGAMVRNGQLVRGASGLAGEFGHMTMYPNGALCKCGNRGCWETVVSLTALVHMIETRIRQHEPTRLDISDLTARSIVDAAQAGDPVAQAALETIGRELGVGLASLVNILNPDLVLIGGLLSRANDFLLPIIKTELYRHGLRWNADTVRMASARYSDQACVMGGAAVVYQTILTQPAGVA